MSYNKQDEQSTCFDDMWTYVNRWSIDVYWIHTVWLVVQAGILKTKILGRMCIKPGMDEQKKHVDIVVLVMTIAGFGIRARCVMGEKRGCSLTASCRCRQFATQEKR